MRIVAKTKEVYEVLGKEFETLEEAEKFVENSIVSELLSYCHSDGDEIYEEHSLASIINVLLDNGCTSRKALLKLKEHL
jgi:hypothetical protein